MNIVINTTIKYHFTYINTMKHISKKMERRAVSTIIATLLMVAVSATGGTAIFGFSQGFFNEQQISAPAGLEQLEVTGFDATDSADRILHNGNGDDTGTGVAATGEGKFEKGDRVYIYLLNKGSSPVAINTLTFAGITYAHNATAVGINIDTGAATTSTIAPSIAGFVIIEEANKTSEDKIPELEAGQEVTIVLALKDAIKVGRNAQLKITTAAGGEFTDVMNIGQHSDTNKS